MGLGLPDGIGDGREDVKRERSSLGESTGSKIVTGIGTSYGSVYSIDDGDFEG